MSRLCCRKISRGSIYLDFSGWRDFLEELVMRTRQDMDRVMEKLEGCGRPSHNHTTRYDQIVWSPLYESLSVVTIPSLKTECGA